MNQVKYVFAGLLLFGVTGYVAAEQEADAAKAECTAMAQDQGITDVDAYVAQCMQEKAAQQKQ